MIDKGFGILPNTILFDKDLSDKEKLLFVIISSLCAEKWYCRANNSYFSDKLWITKSRISNWITSLNNKKYICIDIKKDEWNKRYISIANNSNTYCWKQQEGIAENSKTPIAENSKHNNINNNKINKKTNALSQPILNQWEHFELFWKLFTHPRWTSKKDTLDFYKRSVEDENIILNEVRYMNWCIRYWIIDWQYIPACHKWMRDFVPTNAHIKEQNIKKIVYALMKEKNPEVAKQIIEDFWKEVVDKYVKEYNKEFNTPILK